MFTLRLNFRAAEVAIRKLGLESTASKIYSFLFIKSNYSTSVGYDEKFVLLTKQAYIVLRF